MIVSRLAIVASLAVVAATAACGPRLREGTKAGSKYELARTEVKDMGNGVRLYTHHGWWFTRGGSGRRLTLIPARNGRTLRGARWWSSTNRRRWRTARR